MMERYSPDIVVEALGVEKRFGKERALKEISLQVSRGGVHAVVGRNGAGKSTFFRLLTGFLTPSAGQTRILGAPSTALPPELRGRIGWVTDDHALPGWMKIREVAALQRAHFPRWQDATFQRVLSSFRMGPERSIGALSRGQRAGVSLALALAQRPEVLLLDEPTAGLDVVAKHAFLDALLLPGDEPPCTVLYASHQMDEVERLADRLLVLKRGRLEVSSTPEELWQRIRGWLVDLPEPPTRERIPSLLTSRPLEEHWEILCLDATEEVPATLKRHGATVVEEVPLPFDRAINAFLAAEDLEGGQS